MRADSGKTISDSEDKPQQKHSLGTVSNKLLGASWELTVGRQTVTVRINHNRSLGTVSNKLLGASWELTVGRQTVTVMINHNRSIALERSVINYWGLVESWQWADKQWQWWQTTTEALERSVINWAPSREFVSSSIPSWQILTAHAQPFSGARDLAFCLKVPLDSLLVWASNEGSGETARMRRLAWTFAARIGYKYQIRLTLASIYFKSLKILFLCIVKLWFGGYCQIIDRFIIWLHNPGVKSLSPSLTAYLSWR